MLPIHALSEISEIVKFKTKASYYSDIYITDMIYKSDGSRIHGFIVEKANSQKKKPVVIYCRGGNNHPSTKYIFDLNRKKLCGRLTDLGLMQLVKDDKIIIFASNIRGSRYSEGVDEFCGGDIKDTINLFKIIKQYGPADEKNVSVLGWSRGCTTAMLMHKEVDWINCLVLGAGQYDYLHDEYFRPKMFEILKKKFKFEPVDFHGRSAINWVDKLPKTTPILILHGTLDWRVSVESSRKLDQELSKHDIPHEYVEYPHDNHSLSKNEFLVKAKITQFFTKYMRLEKK